jgi:hypothetical protein
VSAEVVELGEHRDECVVCALQRDVVEVIAVPSRRCPAAACDLESRRPQQQSVQPRDRFVSHVAVGAQRGEPGPRLVVERPAGRGGARGRHRTRPRPSVGRDGTSARRRHRGVSSCPSRGARMRAASEGGQPRSTSSSSACTSVRRSAPRAPASPDSKPARSSRRRRHATTPTRSRSTLAGCEVRCAIVGFALRGRGFLRPDLSAAGREVRRGRRSTLRPS